MLNGGPGNDILIGGLGNDTLKAARDSMRPPTQGSALLLASLCPWRGSRVTGDGIIGIDKLTGIEKVTGSALPIR